MPLMTLTRAAREGRSTFHPSGTTPAARAFPAHRRGTRVSSRESFFLRASARVARGSHTGLMSTG